MRKITIEFELPLKFEDDYKDVHPQIIIDDFLGDFKLPFRIVSDIKNHRVIELKEVK